MHIQMHPMGDYQTNCYLVTIDNKTLIIDPGVNALPWITQHAQNPLAILNTHGHFDHVWSNAAVKKAFDIPIYCPKEDAMFLEQDPFNQGTPKSTPDVLVEGSQAFTIEGIDIEYLHFAGHTPGNSMIRIGDAIFSGDFIFYRSIGRYDFPFSDAQEMKKSLQRFMALDFDGVVYPGHGQSTTIKDEQKHVPYWIESIG